jgi:hypothetical protein
LVAVVATAFLLNARTLGFPFFLDAFHLLREPVTLDSALRIPSFPYYIRPVWMFVVWLGWAISGIDPWGHHLLILGVHVSNTVLVYVTTSMLFGGSTRALLAALLWALFAWNVYNVSWSPIVGSVLVTLFLLATLTVFWRALKTRSRVLYAFAVLMYSIALLSKESAIPFVAVIFVAAWRLEGVPLRSALVYTSPFLAVVAAYWMARLAYLGGDSVRVMIGGIRFSVTTDNAIALVVPMALNYVRQLAFLIVPLPTLPLDLLGGVYVVASLAVSGFLVRQVWAARAHAPDDVRLFWFGASWCVVMTLPHVVASHPHELYPISIGFAMMLAGLGAPIIERRSLGSPAVAVALIVYVGAHVAIGQRVQERFAGGSASTLGYYTSWYLRPPLTLPQYRRWDDVLRAHIEQHLARHGCFDASGAVAQSCTSAIDYDNNALLVKWELGVKVRSMFIRDGRDPYGETPR